MGDYLLKKLVEQSRAAELAESQRSLDEAQQQLDGHRDELDELDRQASTSGEQTAHELVVASRYEGHLQKRIQRAQLNVETRSSEVDDSRSTVQEAWRERRLLEGVHDRVAASETAAEESSERREYDAIALSIYTRNNGGEH